MLLYQLQNFDSVILLYIGVGFFIVMAGATIFLLIREIWRWLIALGEVIKEIHE